MKREEKCMDDNIINIGKQVDKLITMDLDSRGVVDLLYDYAQEHYKLPLTALAANKLHDVLKKDPSKTVLIATGFADRPDIDPAIAESDGPPGAAILARAIHIAYNAAPIILVEEYNVSANIAVLEAAGLRCLSPEQAIAATKNRAPLHGCSVIGFPTDKEEAKIAAHRLVELYDPAAVISTEKGSMNRKGVIHTTRGHDVTAHQSKIDFLMDAAAEKGILTIGVGDGGNEIGMGVIEDEIRANLPHGDICQCPCKGGFAPSTKTDALVVAGVSNWGCYGIAAMLAVLVKDRRVLHTPEMECDILLSCARNSFIDGRSGFTRPTVDGISADVHKSIVNVLGRIVEMGIK